MSEGPKVAVEVRAKARPPASLFALGHGELPLEMRVEGVGYRFVKLFKHDFFAATGLYVNAGTGALAVLKVQRVKAFYGFPMGWLGRYVAGHEIGVYERLQGVAGIPAFLGRVGKTGFLHAYVPGVELQARLPLTPAFFEQLRELFEAIHGRSVAYVDSNKRENILYGEDGRPWLIDFQISYCRRGGWRNNVFTRWMLRRFIRADWYHFYKHKTRLLPSACGVEDYVRARERGMLHGMHRFFSRPVILVRRRFLSRYDLTNTR